MPRARGTCLVTGITAREQTPPPGACPLLSRVRPASCVPFMDFDAFSDACPILTDGFFDENMNYLQWNDTASSTQAPLFPDDSFTFDIEAGLPNDLPFSDGFPKNPWDLDSLFLHEADSTTWNPDWSGGNALDAINDLTSLMSSSDDFPGLEEFWMTADPSLAQAGSSSPTESPPVHLWGSDDNGSGSSTYNLTEHEISNSEARTILGWEWQKSATVWLDEGVSSEVCHFSPPIKVSSERTKFPISSEATAFLIDVTHIPNLDPGITVDALLKDQDVHSWGGSTGSRSKVDAYIPGIFFGCANPEASIATRRSKPKCCGAYACESLAPEFTNVERRELDPNSRDRLVEAQLRTRESQDSTRTGQVLSWALVVLSRYD
ncbi:hypothetical protein DFH09DRAFT_1364803 [Mycena vulgaris]|nr:hypothetical protein DFH09DRAFT_1364803 [Mycena vulgaris]